MNLVAEISVEKNRKWKKKVIVSGDIKRNHRRDFKSVPSIKPIV
jgi:hypothetical protein